MDILRGLIAHAISTATGRGVALTANASDELLVAIGTSGVTQDINIIEIDGTTPTPNVAGFLPTENDIRQIAGSNVAATTVAGTLPVEADHRKVAGQTIATTGINGTFPIEGTVADAAASDASNPIKMGAIVEDVPAGTGIVDTEQAHLITDLLRRLWVRSAAFDSLTTSDQVSVLNSDATDYDSVSVEDANETNLAANTYYYPSSAGRSYGTRSKRVWQLVLADITSCALEVSLDAGSTWIDITPSLIDRKTGLTGYAATHYAAADGSPDNFIVEVEQHFSGLLYRWVVVVPNATESHKIVTVGRAV